jgi:hypothetical protein
MSGFRFLRGQGGSGGGGSFLFTVDIPVSLTGGKTVGKYPTGTTIPAIGKNPQEVFLDIATEYLPPAFTSFAMSGQATAVEVGTIISGSRTFTWGTTNPSNVQANSVKVKDVTNAANIATDLANDGSESVNVGSITKNTLASHAWQAEATNTQATLFTSSQFTVQWQFRCYIGTSNAATLNEAGIEALVTNSIRANKNATYALAAGGYKYFCWPDSYGSPTASTGIKDTATGFPIFMADATDDAFFANTQNGWSYGIVSVTNALGVTTNYRVYRSKSVLGGSFNIQIS